MTDTPECPICGATTKADGEPFANEDSLIGHITSSTGEHRGYGRTRAQMMLRDGEDTGDVQASPAGEQSTSEDSPTTDSGTDPSKQAPDVAIPDGDADDPLADVDGCPDCGAELVDFREHETYTTDDGRMFDTPDDFYCSNGDCARGWNL